MNEDLRAELKEKIDAAKRKINPNEYYGQRISKHKPKPDGGGSGLCPFHVDNEPSFSYKPDGNWYCFSGCGNGDAIDFHMRHKNFTLPEAVSDLEAMYSGANAGQQSAGVKDDAPVKWNTKKDVYVAHNALISNPAKIKEFQDRYGLSLDTITHHKIGIKYDKFTIPISMGQGRYNLKIHKSAQVKGTTAQIYPAVVRDKLIAGEIQSIVLAEGEFKSLLLNEMGITAVSGTAGAATFLPSWAEYFKGADVTILYDNDRGGWQGVRVAAKVLNGAVNSVKAVIWPDTPDMQGIDITDFIVKLNKSKDDVLRLIDGACPYGEGAQGTKTEKAYQLKSIHSLLSKDFPPAKFIFDGGGGGIKITEGISLLCGKPKIGKSWLALYYAALIAHKGTPTLYFALEDNERRLQDRLMKLNISCNNLYYDTEFPTLDNGGLERLEALVRDHEIKFVVIDTWQKIRAKGKAQAGVYEADYNAVSPLKSLADKTGFSVLLIHHLRKAESEDPYERISGSTGLTGAVDTLMVIERTRGQADAVLHSTGRDIEESEIALKWDDVSCIWGVMGDAQDYKISKERLDIVNLLKESGEMAPKDIASALNKKREGIRYLLSKMVKEGKPLIASIKGGKYICI